MGDPTRDELEVSTGGRYSIEGFLAQGGMGQVYTARNRSLGSRVAIKVLPPNVAASDVRLARFKREAALAANLSHPNIVPVFEFDATPSLAYLVMPFVEGQTLSAQLAERGRLEVAEVRSLVDDVGKALAFAHKCGVIHRDIKPANLIQETATDRWMVMDFGVAHSERADDTEITKTGVVLGTPAYMPPEQAIGGKVDERTDLYSLAAVVVQALTGLGFEDLADCLTRGRATIERVVKMAQPRLRPALAKALVWPLEKVPDERPASAEAWLSAIADAERTKSLYRWAWVATAAALAIAVFVMLRPGPGPVQVNRPTIAVAPFRGDVPANASNLSVASLAEALDWQLKYLPTNHRVLGASFRQDIESRYGAAPAETDDLMALARDRGATMLIEGRAGSRGDLLTLEIHVYDAVSQRRIAREDTVGSADSLDALVSALVYDAFAERIELQLSGWQRALPSGLEAWGAFVQGNLDLRRGSYASAVEQYNEVIRRDSSYAPAYFNRMFALMFGTRPSQYPMHIRSGLRAATAYRAGLDSLSRGILEAYEILLDEGDLRRAVSLGKEIVEENPGAVDAWFLIGFVQLYFGAFIGSSPAEAQYQFGQAVRLDSSFAMGWWALGATALLQDETERAEEAISRFLTMDTTSLWAEQARMIESVVFKREIDKVLAGFNRASVEALEAVAASLRVPNPPPGTRSVMSAALDEFWRRSASTGDLRVAFRMRMAELIADGKWASASRHLEDGERRRVPRDELDRWIVLSAFTPLPDLASQPEQQASVQRLLNVTNDRAEACWLAARWYLEFDPSRAQQANEALYAIATTDSLSTPHARSLLLDIDASRALTRGDSATADSLWKRATERYSVDELIYGLTASLWPIRLARAQLASDMGNDSVTVEVARTFTQMAGFTDQVAWPWVLPVLIDSYLQTDDALRARDWRGWLETLLRDADGDGVERLEAVRNMRVVAGG